MLTHIVLFKFKPKTSEPEIERVTENLRELPGKIAEIKEFRLGPDIIRSQRSYDMGLIAGFTDIDALQRYQVHPDHQKVVATLQTITDSIVAVDFLEP